MILPGAPTRVEASAMAGPVMVRPLSEGEDRELLRVVRGVGRRASGVRTRSGCGGR